MNSASTTEPHDPLSLTALPRASIKIAGLTCPVILPRNTLFQCKLIKRKENLPDMKIPGSSSTGVNQAGVCQHREERGEPA